MVTAELSNWNGMALKIPRTEVASCERKDLKGIGVYFLVCTEDDGSDAVYIGEAEDVQKRLNKHINDYKAGKEKYYWNTAIVFLGRDLNKALTLYLENRFVEIARECKQYSILTQRTNTNTPIKEAQIASMEEFIDNTKVLLSALGYKILIPVPVAPESTVYLYCNGGGATAKGFVSKGGFTVLCGSAVSDHLVPSFEKWAKPCYKLREQLVREGVITEGRFTKDYEFTSPSTASAVILGRNSNGNVDWKTEDGTRLKDL